MRSGAEVDLGCSVGGIGLVEQPAFEAKFLDAEFGVIEREFALQPKIRFQLLGWRLGLFTILRSHTSG